MGGFKLVLTGEDLQSNECGELDFKYFQQSYPEIAQVLLNPEILDSFGNLAAELEAKNWKHMASKIMGVLWKSKDAIIFHQPVDIHKYKIPHYVDIVKNPMDFGTIKKKL